MPQLRIATWNMDNWKQTPGSRQAAWAWLRDGVQPDAALLQETIPPKDMDQVVCKEDGIDEKRPWASAVASFGPPLEEIREAKGRYHSKPHGLHRTKPGILAVARAHVPGAEAITLVSLYGLIEDSYATPTVHSVLTDLIPLLDSPAGDRLILGGDLNCSTQFEPPYRAIHQNLFDRFAAHDLVDLAEFTKGERPPLEGCWCAEAPDCGHVRTHDHNQSTRPWNIDYLFASRSLVEDLVSFEVIEDGDPSPWQFSDHCPLVATFDL